MTQKKIIAVYMRGGTSKGVFFLSEWLPEDERERDRLLLRVMSSPDPFEKQLDGMGGASSSTSKVMIVSSFEREDSLFSVSGTSSHPVKPFFGSPIKKTEIEIC
ncbi:hypothetical protein ABJ713_004678 [Escherichia coli]